MQKTIEIKDNDNAYHDGDRLGILLSTLLRHFKLQHGNSYIVTITEGGKFIFKISTFKDHYYLYEKTRFFFFFPGIAVYAGLVCRKHFDALFFVPDINKRYNIKVEKV